MEFTEAELSDDEAVALIAAAMKEILARRGSAVAEIPQDTSAWRFSGRWWNQPIPIGRYRPTVH
ncbi:MAG: hypothetical protein EPN30_01960 [Actinomycetota bacterium]|nr:MAG: hypothetical protein EPN30_01960 [Actinomycetota bacterium]